MMRVVAYVCALPELRGRNDIGSWRQNVALIPCFINTLPDPMQQRGFFQLCGGFCRGGFLGGGEGTVSHLFGPCRAGGFFGSFPVRGTEKPANSDQ